MRAPAGNQPMVIQQSVNLNNFFRKRDASQYTFANVGVDATPRVFASRVDNVTEHHGWQSAMMTAMMWMANVVGEFLDQAGEKVHIDPVNVPLTVIDDPTANLEFSMRGLQIAFKERSAEACWSAPLLHSAVGAPSSLLIINVSMDS